MVGLGYKLNGNTFEHSGGSPFTVEFPKGPPMLGGEAIGGFDTVRRDDEVLNVINPTDCVRDRLAHFYFWNDRTALRAAAAVALAHRGRVDMGVVKEWSIREGHLEKFEHFMRDISRPVHGP